MSDFLNDGESALPGGMLCDGTSMSCTPTVEAFMRCAWTGLSRTSLNERILGPDAPIPDSFKPGIRETRKMATTYLTDFLVGLTSQRDQRKSHAQRGGPPLHDHPMSIPEIGGALNRCADEVYEHFIGMQNLAPVEKISLVHVPGVYSKVFVPNPHL